MTNPSIELKINKLKEDLLKVTEQSWNTCYFQTSKLKVEALLGEYFEEELRHSITRESESNICGHVFARGEPVYHCNTCGIDATCVLCSKCFHATKHDGHNLTVLMSSDTGGCCDCGDLEAFKLDLNCPYHGSSVVDKMDVDSIRSPETLRKTKFILEYCLGQLVPWLLDDESPDDMNTYGKVKSPENIASMFPNESEFALVLWNDEFHSYNEVTDIISDVFNQSYEFGHEVAEAVDQIGRKVIDRSSNIENLVTYAKKITGIKLSCSIRPSKMIFCEDMAYDIFLFVLRLCQGNSPVRQSVIEVLFDKPSSNILLSPFTNTSKYDELVSTVEFRATCVPKSNLLIQDYEEFNKRNIGPAPDGSKLLIIDLLLLLDIKLWKNFRKELNKAYVYILLSELVLKKAVAIRFYYLYDILARYFVLMDRESERSVYLFSLQLLTTPSVSIFMQQKFHMVNRILDIMKSFYLMFQQDSSNSSISDFITRVCHLYPLPSFNNVIQITTLKTKTFEKRRRLNHLFSDLSYILNSMSVLDINDGIDFETIEKIFNFLKIFDNMHPQTRRSDSHVLYADNEWAIAFETSMKLLSFIREVSNIIRRNIALNEKCFNYIFQRLEPTSTASDSQSFHHPTLWLLGHISLDLNIKLYQSLSIEQIKIVSNTVMNILTLCAEVRAGKWVYNGDVMINQLYNYRSSRMWDDCYDIEVHMLQTVGRIHINLDEVKTFWKTLEEKFAILTSLEHYHRIDVVEQRKDRIMVEDFLLLCIYIIVNNVNFRSNLRFELISELIPQLCTGPCPYSKLTARLSDRLEKFCDNDNVLEEIVNEISVLKFPDVMENGKYEIKREWMENYYFPYLQHSSPSMREKSSEYITKRTMKSKVDYQRALEGLMKYHPKEIKHLYEDDFIFSVILNVMMIYSEVNSVIELCCCLLKMILIMGNGENIIQARITKNGNDYSIIQYLLKHGDKFCLEELKRLFPEELNKFNYDQMDLRSPNERSSAQERQRDIMKRFETQQSAFSAHYQDLYDEVEDSDCNDEEQPTSNSTAARRDLHHFDKPSCILCQEPCNNETEFGLLALSQVSFVLSEEYEVSPNEIEVYNVGMPFMSTCGHIMHSSCLTTYFDGASDRRRQNNVEEVGEQYLCPLCKCVGNSFIPIVSDVDFELSEGVPEFEDWLTQLTYKQTDGEFKYLDEHFMLTYVIGNKLFEESWDLGDYSYDFRFSTALNRILSREEIENGTSLSRILYGNICINELNYRLRNISPSYNSFLANYYIFNLIMYNLPDINIAEEFETHLLDNKYLLFYDQFELYVLWCCYHYSNIQERKHFARLFLIFEFVRILLFHEHELDKIYLKPEHERIKSIEGFERIVSIVAPNIQDEDRLRSLLELCIEKSLIFRNRVELLVYYAIRFKDAGGMDTEENKYFELFGENLENILRVETTLNDQMIKILTTAVENWKITKTVDCEGKKCMNMPCFRIYDELPHSYSDLLEQQTKCDTCNTVPMYPAICLVCGKVLCTETICCNENPEGPNEIQRHLLECRREVGMFLIVKRCFVLMCYRHYQISVMAPYMDKHGETDVGLRLGTLQQLHRERLEELKKIWIELKMPEFISRRLERNEPQQIDFL